MPPGEALDSLRHLSVACSQGLRGSSDSDYADRYAVSVSELEVLACFDRMSDAVAQVQELALPVFAFVRGDDCALDVDVSRDQLCHASYVLFEQVQCERGLLEFLKQLLISDYAVLDDLAASV